MNHECSGSAGCKTDSGWTFKHKSQGSRVGLGLVQGQFLGLFRVGLGIVWGKFGAGLDQALGGF